MILVRSTIWPGVAVAHHSSLFALGNVSLAISVAVVHGDFRVVRVARPERVPDLVGNHELVPLRTVLVVGELDLF